MPKILIDTRTVVAEAKRGNVQAVFNLGLLSTTRGVTDQEVELIGNRPLHLPKDDNAALRWFLQAAYRGHSEAQYQIWRLFEQRRATVARDNAIKWLVAAARQGHRAAMAALEKLKLGEVSHFTYLRWSW